MTKSPPFYPGVNKLKRGGVGKVNSKTWLWISASTPFQVLHTNSALCSRGNLPDSAFQAKEHFLFTSLKQTLITGRRSIPQHWKRCWPTPDCTRVVQLPRCEHLLRAAEARSKTAPVAPLLDPLTNFESDQMITQSKMDARGYRLTIAHKSGSKKKNLNTSSNILKTRAKKLPSIANIPT